MSYEDFWYNDPTMVVSYRKAYKMKQKIKEYDIWKQGMYVYDALCKVSPILHAFAKNGTKPLPYPEEPYGIKEYEEETKTRQQKEKEIENERLKAQLHFKQLYKALNAHFKEGGENK